MKKTLASALAISIAATQTSGCENMNISPTLMQGAAIGAVSGGALGATMGNKKDAAIGAVLGAAAGALIANYLDHQAATRAQAAQKYHYNDRTNKLEVENTTVTPQSVTPGGTVDSSVRYTTLAPTPSQSVAVTETRSLISGQESVDLGKRQVMRPQGTHMSTAKIKVPKDFPKGNYILSTTISDGKDTKTAQSPFQVV
jgi:hypothetical protein